MNLKERKINLLNYFSSIIFDRNILIMLIGSSIGLILGALVQIIV